MALVSTQFIKRIYTNVLSKSAETSVRTLPILLGPLRGSRICVDSSLSFGEILGIHEIRTLYFLKNILIELKKQRPHLCVADLGANMGLFSLFFSKIAGENSSHIDAFEPNPRTFEVLWRNVLLNHRQNIECHRIAFSDLPGKIDFLMTENNHTSHILESGSEDQPGSGQRVSVDATTLDSFYREKGITKAPDFIKVDIEGAASLALKSCDWCLETKRPWLFIESHTPEEDAAIGKLALKHKYVAFDTVQKRWIKDLSATFPNPDGVSGRPLLIPEEVQSSLQAILK